MSQAKTDFSRKKASRKSRDTVLIVCEGKKTEPQYFRDMIADLGLSSADVRICGGECGTDPLSVINYAIKILKDSPRGFDYTYCVIDRDTHANFDAALSQAISQKSRKTNSFEVTWSDPCFEYWILLHFGYSAKPYMRAGRLSSCDAVIKDLKSHLGDYEKNNLGLYKSLKTSYNTARLHAVRRNEECKDQGGTNPSTLIHIVCSKLHEISEDAKPKN
ncbi:RloB family protein [Methylobacterium gossipiicola]|uniref:RloB-like protein n=1 Tax=Methylobacterium gossipiicola TaxID=582675 RepID=A0A1I2VTZ1_9HYPH|nr:RloB family protein [Methylobacterium gossipiicola]SFG92688.1 RloB-like protein [Methylobacterium gossipiicola]